MTIDKPAPKGAKARKPAKRCYELAGKAVLEDETRRLVLIHGVKPHELQNGGGWYDHAWVLDPRDDTVFDSADQQWHQRAHYPGIERVRYTRAQLSALLGDDRHWRSYDVVAQSAQLIALQVADRKRSRSIPLPREPGRYAVRNGAIVRVEDGPGSAATERAAQPVRVGSRGTGAK
jgi:hypothetical protein